MGEIRERLPAGPQGSLPRGERAHGEGADPARGEGAAGPVESHRGAIYEWDQTVGNSGDQRIGHSTPVKNLYLAGAWSRPGHG